MKSKQLLNSIVSIFISLLILSCKKPEKIQSEKVQPEQVLKNFTAFEYKEGKKVWKLIADEAKLYETEKIATIKGFTIYFFSEDGNKVVTVLKAPSGKIDTNNNDFFTIGKTILKTEKNETLECEKLVYKSSLNKIFSDCNVKLTREDAIITGKGIEATPDLSSIIIKENIVEIKK